MNTTDRLASFAVKLTPGYTAIWHTAGRVPGLRPAVRKALSLVRL